MMFRFRLFLIVILSCSSLLLAGCKSDEEKAEQFYQSGLTLYEEGDSERALVELRNVFNYDGFHKEARQTYANILVELGRKQEAYSQYLRLIEQYPDTVDVRVTLAEMAIATGNSEEAERHGSAAQKLAPDRLDVKAIGLAVAYRDASLARDNDARAQVAEEATQLLAQMRAEDMSDNAALVRVVIDNLARSETPTDALPALNAALEQDPEARDLNLLRAQLLAASGDVAGTGAQLRKMVEIFPDDTDIQKSLMSWYLSQKDMDGAEAYLRELAGDDTGPAEKHVSVIQFLQATQGRPAARDELARLIAVNADTQNEDFYRSMLALMDYEDGEAESAIADMRTILDGAEPGEQTLRMKAMLAQMLIGQGDTTAADTVLAGILAEDSSNVPALKMRASRMIDQDRVGEAIIDLRAALDQSPRDAGILTLMALAHERDGDIDLMGERLALAVEVSNSAPAEAMRYAQFLVSQGRDAVAVSVLDDARRAAPANVSLLLSLADLYQKGRDWPQAQSIAQTLKQIDTAQARQAATELEARILQGQNRTEDSLALLEAQIGEGTDASEKEIARTTGLIVQTHVRNGKDDLARAAVGQALAAHPSNGDLLLLAANFHAYMGETAEAERGYRDLMERFPSSELPVRLLINLLESTGRRDDADTVLDGALEKAPAQANLLFMKAGRLERKGDIDGAIDIYEQLYALNSGSTIVANNLASLLSTYREDDQSLERATKIARRLRDTSNPAFQDTYGWIAYRRGNAEEALKYLEPAAAALTNDPLVQYHLGMVYADLERTDEARKTLANALDRAGDSPLPQFETARETLAKLEGKTDP
jgi:predicted Zn-dependent protease